MTARGTSPSVTSGVPLPKLNPVMVRMLLSSTGSVSTVAEVMTSWGFGAFLPFWVLTGAAATANTTAHTSVIRTTRLFMSFSEHTCVTYWTGGADARHSRASRDSDD